MAQSILPPNPQRRLALKLAASALATHTVAARANDFHAKPVDNNANATVMAAVNDFATLAPATTGCLVYADVPNWPWSAGVAPDRQLFVGSAVKTFILAQFLIDVENGRNGVTEDTEDTISDAVRSVASPVFLGLNGTIPFRSVLEAMIGHSDNTATDMTLASVTPARVRKLIAAAGLTETKIPDSTRLLFSYLAGAPYGVDLGWAGVNAALDQPSLPNARPAINDRETMLSTATEMVKWYRQVLRGTYFRKPATLTEFKRVSAQANAIPLIVPPDIAAYAKGGSIDWQGFHALCVAGQMVVDRVPVTFCFTYNWTADQAGAEAPQAFAQKAGAVLQASVDAIRT